MGKWLRSNGFEGISTQGRYRALLCLENLAAIVAFRDGLDEARRRRLNHPGAVWFAWRRVTNVETAAPTRRHFVKGSQPHQRDQPVYWPADHIRRAATASGESGIR